MSEQVILVDKNDQEIGTREKMAAHRNGELHRAFSVFVYNADGEVLLQRRAETKYHSGGLWTNTCCSHPRPGESTEAAAHRRLQEEMGFDCDLEEIFQFTYHAKLDNDLFEHEYDHVLVGTFEGTPAPNPTEVSDYKWISVEKLAQDVQDNPDHYTHWFKIALDRVIDYL